jgi:hypothetical protein
VNHIANALVDARVAELHREARVNRALHTLKPAAGARVRRASHRPTSA